MKIIRSARSRGTVIARIVTCHCGCEFQVESKELAKFKLIPDGRDGDYYEIPCPEPDCNQVCNVASSLFS